MELAILYIFGVIISIFIGYFITRWYHDIGYRNQLLEEIRDELKKMNSVKDATSIPENPVKPEKIKVEVDPKIAPQNIKEPPTDSTFQNVFLFILIAVLLVLLVMFLVKSGGN